MPFVIQLQRRGSYVEAAPPDENLLLAVLLDSFQLIESLQGSVVSLVEPPTLDDGDVVGVELVGGVVECLDGPGQH